ncbi:MAG: hypothetical protein ACR2KH_00995, partial [Sphingomicrobium sp.]
MTMFGFFFSPTPSPLLAARAIAGASAGASALVFAARRLLGAFSGFSILAAVVSWPASLKLAFLGVVRNSGFDRGLGVQVRRRWNRHDRFGLDLAGEEAGRLVALLRRVGALPDLLAEHSEPVADRLRTLVRLDDHRRVDRRQEPLAVAGPFALCERLAEAGVQPLEHLGRLLARHALVHDDAERIDVRPRPLRIGPHVLLDRRVGRRVERHLGAGRLGGLE